MGKLKVQVTDATYDVHIEKDAYQLFSTDYAKLLESADRIAIIADETVAALHLPQLEQALMHANLKVTTKTVPGGEHCKTSETYVDCLSFLLREGFTRNSMIIAFGGGACGDLVGFVAATFMRGIRYIHCPTTILAHDSAVGGKTAINMPEGKNMVGAFHQPSAVIFNSELFASLPAREIRSGLAELLKHAFISDEAWTQELLTNAAFTQPSLDWLSVELLKGIAVKAKIVAEDEFEQSTRKFLNFGHTFGHAVEAASGYGKLSHGECVMIGMAYSLLLSEKFGQIDQALTSQFIEFAKVNGYSFTAISEFSFEVFLGYMQKDKKASFGKMNFALLDKVGSPFVTEVSVSECQEAFQELKMRTGELV